MWYRVRPGFLDTRQRILGHWLANMRFIRCFAFIRHHASIIAFTLVTVLRCLLPFVHSGIPGLMRPPVRKDTEKYAESVNDAQDEKLKHTSNGGGTGASSSFASTSIPSAAVVD